MTETSDPQLKSGKVVSHCILNSGERTEGMTLIMSYFRTFEVIHFHDVPLNFLTATFSSCDCLFLICALRKFEEIDVGQGCVCVKEGERRSGLWLPSARDHASSSSSSLQFVVLFSLILFPDLY